ncbi:unnamed protein product [Rhizophagus irregularis]|uniref:BTB domain-containing protein n=1 Tax=Rhizophagus irregularis TaxID=588596 RepID=A0A915YZU1_9GLOM|nr:unnamed protein product [Rhizophagus irregularis]
MTRGYSLEQDLRLLVNNPKYSDVEILCEDEKILHGCRAILAARSDVFDRLLYNGMKESYEKQISFPKIKSAGMEIILEYIYTGSVKEESLTKDNTVEAFYAADYFQLSDLQDFILKTVKNSTNFAKNYSPELLTKISEKMPLTEDNILLNLLVEAAANISLNNIEFGRLSITGLKYLLSCTYEKEKPFVTPEYEVFRYSAILAAKQVSNDAHKILMKQLPTLEQRIKPQILADIIEPLEIIPDKIISNVYRYVALSSNLNLNNTRGISINEIGYVWDKSACGSKFIIEDNGKIVYAPKGCGFQSVRAKIALEDKGNQPTGWVLGFGGAFRNHNNYVGHYCPPFQEDGARITVHLDMNKRTCAFTVNGKKYAEVSEWNNLPSKLYPVVSFNSPGRFQILPHQKN